MTGEIPRISLSKTSEPSEVRHEGITFRPLVLSSAALQELIDTFAKSGVPFLFSSSYRDVSKWIIVLSIIVFFTP